MRSHVFTLVYSTNAFTCFYIVIEYGRVHIILLCHILDMCIFNENIRRLTAPINTVSYFKFLLNIGYYSF